MHFTINYSSRQDSRSSEGSVRVTVHGAIHEESMKNDSKQIEPNREIENTKKGSCCGCSAYTEDKISNSEDASKMVLRKDVNNEVQDSRSVEHSPCVIS